MVAMVQFNPELAKSTPSDLLPSYQAPGARPTSLYSGDGPSARRSMYGNLNLPSSTIEEELDADDEIPVGHHFTFIPPNPKKFYKRLLELALIADLEVMLSPEVDDSDEVSLGILSPSHIELINECALRWRIGHPYRAACFLDLVKQFYERNDVPMECVPEALQTISKVVADTEIDKWPVHDVRNYSNARTASHILAVGLSSKCLRKSFQHFSFQSLPCYGCDTQPETCRY